jgi:hypothetical protein
VRRREQCGGEGSKARKTLRREDSEEQRAVKRGEL